MNIIKFLKESELDGITQHIEIKQLLFKEDIVVSYTQLEGEEESSKTRRYIFTASQRSRKNKLNELHSEANGLILQAPDWKPLFIPVITPKQNVDTKLINSYLEKKLYDIYYIEDGTILNLYYYDSTKKWVISSSKGIEVNDIGLNLLTYSDLLHDCLKLNSVNVDEFYKNLDKTTCYSFGVKHVDIHPFTESVAIPFKIWFVQSNKIEVDDEGSVNIHINKKSPIKNIPNHKKIDFKPNNVYDLFKRNKSAFENFAENKIINFGYLLVAKNPDDFKGNIDNSRIMLKSNLMSTITSLWYDVKYMRYAKSTNFDRSRIIILQAFLDNNAFQNFNILFPQYKSQMDKFSKLENVIIHNVYKYLTNTDYGIDQTQKQDTIVDIQEDPKEIKESDSSKEEHIDAPKVVTNDNTAKNSNENLELSNNNVTGNLIIEILSKKVKDKISIEKHNNPLQKIRDIIHTPDNIDEYYKYSFKV